MGKRLAANTARTPDLNALKRFSILYGVILSNKKEGRKEERGTFMVMAFAF